MRLPQAVQREAAGGAFPHRPVVAEDSLDIRERQVGTPQRDSKFDWSGSTNYTEMSRKVCPTALTPFSRSHTRKQLFATSPEQNTCRSGVVHPFGH